MKESVTGNSTVLGVLGNNPNEGDSNQTPASGSKRKPAKKEEPKQKRDARISVALTEDMAQAIKDEAWQQRRSLNDLLVEIIESYMKKQQRKGK